MSQVWTHWYASPASFIPVAVILSLAFLLVLLLCTGRNGIGSFWFIELSSIFSCGPVLWCLLLLIFQSQIIYKNLSTMHPLQLRILYHCIILLLPRIRPTILQWSISILDCCFLLSVSTILSLIDNICYLCVDVYRLRKCFSSSFACYVPKSCSKVHE